jgi:hypothetical protein
MNPDEPAVLRAKTFMAAQQEKTNTYKTTTLRDGTVPNPGWLGH